MRVLFLHSNFPAQYRYVAAALAGNPANRVVFATSAADGSIPGVGKVLFKPARAARADTHPYMRSLEGAVLNGQAVYRACESLRRSGFVPDVVCGHSGWGPLLYVKEAFPDARTLGYFEWYYHPRGSDADFLDPAAIGADEACRIVTRNASILLDLAQCDWGVSPTEFQWSQFPAAFRPRISVLHDGIDTEFFRPCPTPRLELPGRPPIQGEILTYATRGMEPYRGFPQFMRAAARLMAERPRLQVVVVGADRVAYGQPLAEGGGYKQRLLAELPGIDMERLHFTGLLPYRDYLRVLQASSVHVYLTVPFVLSWSLLEALAAGCLVVASDTAPVREAVADGQNGLLADFFSPEDIAARISAALDGPERHAGLRVRARQTVLERFDLRLLLPRHLQLVEDVAAGLPPPAVALQTSSVSG